MIVLDTQVDPADAVFTANRDRMQAARRGLCARISARARKAAARNTSSRHRAQGKLPFAIASSGLLDSGSPFLELSPLAAFDMYDGDAPCAGLGHRHRTRVRPRGR
jgi:hypothetical protein